MTDPLAFACRSLDDGDLDEARATAAASGIHGVYVANALAATDAGEGDGEDVDRLAGAERLLGLLFFGRRGNLIVLEREPLEPERVAAAVGSSGAEWRIALTSPGVADLLARREQTEPLVHRTQVYYAIDAHDAPFAPPRADVRRAERRDTRALVDAALDLNQSDLGIPPWRVNRHWLRESVRRRLRAGRTFVIGPPGEPHCKLDLGSVGPAGVVLEGVHTVEAHRGQGLASGLVACVARDWLARHPLVCLHVAADNGPARRAYERAGLQPRGECALLLRG